VIVRGQEATAIGGRDARTTNNRMELRAAVEGLRHIPPDARVRITTDSEYLINGATRWLPGWRRAKWVTKAGTPVEHRDLWEQLGELDSGRVTWEHVRGHTGHAENEWANAIAQAFADGRPAPLTHMPSASQSARSGASYLSLVGDQLMRHATWDECRARVHGVSGARFKKCLTSADELAVVTGWGIPAEALTSLE
jgi:ribonuclease HI